jgi:hypothetical protein
MQRVVAERLIRGRTKAPYSATKSLCLNIHRFPTHPDAKE